MSNTFVQRAHTMQIPMVTVAYFLLGKLGLFIAVPPGFATIIWPASGLALAVVLLYGVRVVPGIFLGAFILNCTVSGALHFMDGKNFAPTFDVSRAMLPMFIALGSSLQAVIASVMVRKAIGPVLDIKSWKTLLYLGALIVPLGCIISATCGVGALYLEGTIHAADIINNWLIWWGGDIFGVVVFTPLILISPPVPRIVYWQGDRIAPLHFVTLLTLLLPLVITLYAWKATSYFIYEKNMTNFQMLAKESENAFINRIQSYNQALVASSAYYFGSETITRREWKEYIEAFQLDKYYPGISGIGLAIDVGEEGIENYQRRRREDDVPSFQVHPQGNFPDNFIVTYIEPIQKNAEAVGYNLASEKRSYDAALLARDTGTSAMTQPILMIKGQNETSEFLLLHPIYREKGELKTVQDKRNAFLGWIYAPFVARNFMSGLTIAQGQLFHIRAYDTLKADDNLIYDSNPLRKVQRVPQFSVETSVDVMKRKWIIEWESTPIFESAIETFEAKLILISGISFTVFFGLFLVMFSRRTETVQRLVDKKTEELRVNKEELQMIFDNVPARIWVKDSLNNIMRLNKKAADSMNGAVKDFEGKSTYDLFPTMAKKYHDDDLEALSGGVPKLGIIEEYVPLNGPKCWIETSKIPYRESESGFTRLLVVSKDITEQKVAQEALLKSEELNELVIRGLSAGVWDWDISGEKVYFSRRMREILNWEHQGMTVPYNDFFGEIHDDDQPRVTRSMQSHLEDKTPYDVECRIRNGLGEYVWVHICGQASWDKNGKAMRMVGSLTDISERKHAEEELVRSNLELERFAYVASHDLQEPARMIRSFTDLLEDEYGDQLQGDAREYLKYIRRGSENMRSMIEDLLEYSHAGQTNSVIEDVDLNFIIHGVLETLKPSLLECGGTVTYDTLPIIRGNPVRLSRLLQNLIGNGLKYRRPNVVPEVHVMAEDIGEEWLLSVSDNGIGIRSEYLTQIFVIFKRLHTRKEYQGTGIGLAICKKIVEGMNGRIWAESSYGEGTDILFTIPKAHEGYIDIDSEGAPL